MLEAALTVALQLKSWPLLKYGNHNLGGKIIAEVLGSSIRQEVSMHQVPSPYRHKKRERRSSELQRVAIVCVHGA